MSFWFCWMIAILPKKLVDLGKNPQQFTGLEDFSYWGDLNEKSEEIMFLSKSTYVTNLKLAAIGGWFPLYIHHDSSARSQWGHYNLPRCFVLMIHGLIGNHFLFTMNCRGRVRSSVAIHLSNTPDKHISVKGHNINAKRLSHVAFHRKSSTKGTLGVQFQLYIGSRTIVAIVHSSYIPNLWQWLP